MARKLGDQGGGRLTRSETVTIRLDPRLNYLCELAARVQRRTKSSFIEAVIDDAIHSIHLQPRDDSQFKPTIGDRADQLWSVREHERLIALAANAPHLMTMSEQEIWAVICEHGYFWRGKWTKDGLDEVWTWECHAEKLIPTRVAECWDTIREVASGKAGRHALPAFKDRRESEIPF